MTFAHLWRALLMLCCLLAAGTATAQDFPKFTGLVVDAANVLPADRKAALEQQLEALQASTRRQLVVATVPTLNGDDVSDYANRLFRAWGIGLKGADNGVLLLVAPAEHKVRIEVGYGLEPWVTDALSFTVIQNDITPRFKAGDLPGGIAAGVDALSKQLALPEDEARAKNAAAEADYNRTHQRRAGRGGGFPVGMIFWGVILLFVVLPMLGRGRQGGTGSRWGGGGSNLPVILWGMADAMGRESRGGGGGWGGDGGGGSDGSWGGGGFTGGGGGSSGGGGASGGW